MRINREKIREILDEQKKRDFMNSGYSPSLVYGCFYDLGEHIEDTEDNCEQCRHYFHCESYLKAVSIEENPFEKARRKAKEMEERKL